MDHGSSVALCKGPETRRICLGLVRRILAAPSCAEEAKGDPLCVGARAARLVHGGLACRNMRGKAGRSGDIDRVLILRAAGRNRWVTCTTPPTHCSSSTLGSLHIVTRGHLFGLASFPVGTASRVSALPVSVSPGRNELARSRVTLGTAIMTAAILVTADSISQPTRSRLTDKLATVKDWKWRLYSRRASGHAEEVWALPLEDQHVSICHLQPSVLCARGLPRG